MKRFIIIDEDFNIWQTDDEDLAKDAAEVHTVIDTQLGIELCGDHGDDISIGDYST